MANKKSAEKEIAWLKFFHENTTKQEIAKDLGVAPRTISAWALEDRWDEKKNMLKQTDYTAAAKLNGYIAALYASIDGRADVSKRYPTPSEADSLNKMLAARKQLMQGIQLPQLYEACIKILNHIKNIDLPLAQSITPHIDSLIKEEAAKYTQ